MADIHALYFGDGNPAGAGVADATKRWPQILSAALALTPHAYAVEGAGYMVQSKSVLAQLTVAAADANVPADSVGLVVLAAGYEDAKANADVSSAAAQAFAIANAIRKRYRNAKLAIMVGPQGLEPDGFEDSCAPFMKGLSAAARTVGADVVIDAWDWLFGKPGDVQSDGVHPNEAGHALLAAQAQPLMPGVDVPEPPDLTPVDPLGVRKYAPGRADYSMDALRMERKRNKEKAQANNSTGTETSQTTIKLNALTKLLQAQQELTTGLTARLAQSQQKLQIQQRELKRVAPTYGTISGDSDGGSLGSGWTTLVSLTAHPDLSDGKTRAQLTIGVSAVKSGDGMPLLECLVGGDRVGTFPGVTANGDSFGGTTIAYVTADQPVVLRGKSTVDAASPIGAVRMSMTVMNLA
ncbi:MAG: SGNH/GDSL hydrolase family protein [Bifidobacterium tibiigranuli]|jgi:lysophospholipase L1-like esterase|uniref:SGNH/GDSL hydrolase family protein n=1 Tax=Bifidobacterium tibiigranuli TaxID=2172043 RepID=UPI002356093D|nr:SGNH/GDSL hydrolase family protein [Bifidobacterium tibiigranuli]MCH3975076.1 SGNH/GDSL hydrolase family protein [Bifidobacterium tibiigranuli]MCH4202834.1 SGNH/GDSL hydrolase family protein [Bifidobacterium tibiigranuli]MCH4274914.1 SGNH/GDSL hydrolase family protein [Bifidobacterium tibiigranuli]